MISSPTCCLGDRADERSVHEVCAAGSAPTWPRGQRRLDWFGALGKWGARRFAVVGSRIVLVSCEGSWPVDARPMPTIGVGLDGSRLVRVPTFAGVSCGRSVTGVQSRQSVAGFDGSGQSPGSTAAVSRRIRRRQSAARANGTDESPGSTAITSRRIQQRQSAARLTAAVSCRIRRRQSAAQVNGTDQSPGSTAVAAATLNSSSSRRIQQQQSVVDFSGGGR